MTAQCQSQKIKTCPTCSLPISKRKGHCACVGDVMGQTYPIYARTGTHHFIGSRHTLLQMEGRVFKVTLEKNLISRKSRAYGTMHAVSFIFFVFEGFNRFPQFKGDKLYTKITQKKKNKIYIYIYIYATVLVQELKTIVLFYLVH